MTETPTPAPPLPPDIEAELVEYGQATFEPGITFEEWSALIVKRLGPKVKRWLPEVWAKIQPGGRHIAPPPLSAAHREMLYDYGREILKDGHRSFPSWSRQMAEDLGDGVTASLPDAWSALMKERTQEPKTMSASETTRQRVSRATRWLKSRTAALLRSGKRVALWVLAVGVLFVLGVVWSGGLYTVTTGAHIGRAQIVYRTNRITGTVEAAACRVDRVDDDFYVYCLWP